MTNCFSMLFLHELPDGASDIQFTPQVYSLNVDIQHIGQRSLRFWQTSYFLSSQHALKLNFRNHNIRLPMTTWS
ncbi:hypothetical protein QQF64_023849, partial [Cirrhinus molitorella]